jgi:hypothetical protein
MLGALLLSGCAFVSMKGAAKGDPPGVYPVCSDRAAPWVLDALAGTVAGAAAASAATERESAVTIGAGATAGLLVGSAVYGIANFARCRQSRRAYVAPEPAYRLDADGTPLRAQPPRFAAPPRPASAPAPAPTPAPTLVVPPVPVVPYQPPTP